MFRFLSYMFVISGMSLLLFGGYQLWETSSAGDERLDAAQAMVAEDNRETEVKDVDLDAFYAEFQQGDTIGLLYIPRLDREIPIVSGTDEEELAQGVGHFMDTALPGQNQQILLSGHRDTVFRQFGELEHGDEFHIKMEHGTFIYEILDDEIVDANDRTVIDPSREDEYLTVSTCYPFSYIGSAPDRYVFYAYPKE